jgi:hypothetical protein
MNLTARLDDPNMEAFASIVDPLAYKERLATLPLLVVDGGMDEFFLPDDQRFWWTGADAGDVLTDKHLLMAPNTEHSFATGILEALPAMAAWVNAHLHGFATPAPTWTIEEGPEGGTIAVQVVTGSGGSGSGGSGSGGSGGGGSSSGSEEPPAVKEVAVWAATSCANEPRRDFRVLTADDPCPCGVISQGQCVNAAVVWHKTPLNATSTATTTTTNTSKTTAMTTATTTTTTTYVATVAAPPEGQWTAFFVDLIYESLELGWPVGRPGEMEFTTEVSIVPNAFPYSPCEGTDCKGTIV